MRYEDASQTDSLSNELPVARDDSDALAAGARGPATGNVITGDGTQTGSVGADVLTTGARITAVEGAGGSDSDPSGGKLNVTGEFGKLSVDAQGNYSYLANQGAPETARDYFTYRLTDSAGNSDSARLMIEIGKTQAQVTTQQVVVGPGGVVVLPAGVTLNDIRVVGRDLVITLADGSQMVIKDGAVFVPQLVLDNVEIPATNLAALLIDSEPRPAAGGQPPSSGGNFEVPVGPLDPGVDLGDLIPPTELIYTPPDFIDVGVDIENRAPFAFNDEINVSEEGLTAGLTDSAGTPDTTDSATATGSILAGDDDGDTLAITLGIPTQALESHDVPIVWTLSAGGTVLTGTAGGATVIVVTIQNDGDYTVVQSRPIDHPNGAIEDGVSFVIPVNVSDGDDFVDTTITVTIEDDGPRVSNVSVGSSVLLDETDGANPLSSGAPIVATSATAMVAASVAYGADGVGTAPVYGLSLLGGANSLVSNVQTAVGDFPITLTLTSSTLITATYQSGGTQTAFTIAMNANGTITVRQFTALEHLVDGPPGPAHDDALTLNSAALGNLVNATVTYRDFDGDAVAATAAIGGAITFEDDGPSINVIETIPADQEGPSPLLLLTGDDGTEGAGSTTDSTTANFAGVFSLVSDGGADGAATPAIVYSLGLLVTGGADSNLNSNGQSIFLYNVGGVVVGSTSATAPGTATDASVVFALSVNGAGAVTLTQYQQIDHPISSDPSASEAPFADQIAVLGGGFVEVIASATITDNDGDTATDVERFDFGNFVRFADDGPAIDASLVANATIRIDETDSVAAAGGESDPVGGNLGTVTMSLGTLFSVSNGSVSADAPTTLAYTLTLGAAVQGLVNSGLQLSTTDAPIYLYFVGTTVVGSTALVAPVALNDPSIAFTVSIDGGTGAVTLTQFLAVEHAIPGSSHDEDSSGLLAGALNVTVTATDFDGDTDGDSVDLGSIIRFEDDGPTIDVTANLTLEPTIRLTTGDVGTEGEGSTSDSTASGNFGGVFGLTFTAGSDGAATPGLAFTLGTPGGASGLESHDVAINLYYIVGTNSVVGSTAASIGGVNIENTVFAVTVSGSGVVTLTQYQQIDHPLEAAPNAAPFADQLIGMLDSSVTLTASSNIIDNDEDTASDSVTINIGANLRFADDGPAITGLQGGPGVILDETSGASPLSSGSPISATSAFPVIGGGVDYGADGKGADPVFGLSLLGTTAIGSSIGSGLATAVGDLPIMLTLTSATLITATYQSGGTQTAFTIQMNANGTITVTQFTALEHLVDGSSAAAQDDSLDLDNAFGNLVNATVTYQDFDGDTATATAAIGAAIVFKDDGPSVAVADVATDLLVLDESPVGTETDGDGDPVGRATITANFADNFAEPDYGADGAGSTSYALILTGTNVASGLFALGVNGLPGAAILLNQNSGTGVITGSVGATNYFTITVDGNGVVTFTQLANVYHSDTGNDDDTSSLNVDDGVLVIRQTVTDADGDSDSASINLGAGIFQIEDDGPDSQLAVGQVADVMVLDESPALQDEGGDFDPAGRNSITAEFADNFNVLIDYGTDGAGSVRYSFVLNGANVASGLYALEAGDGETAVDPFGRGAEIVLNLSGNTITGSVGGTQYFTIVIDADTGQVTFNQINPIWHGNTGSDDDTAMLTAALESLFVRQTVTDRDGDSDFAQVDVSRNVFQIEDDGPRLLAGNGGTTVDEDELAGGITDGDLIGFSNTGSLSSLVDFGSDGSGGFSFSSALLAGLPVVTSGGAAVNYAVSADGLTLTAYTGANPALDTVFTVVITNAETGAYTFTLVEQLDHAGPLVSGIGDNQLLSLNLSSAVVARDGDGDQVSLTGGFIVTVEDDIPTVNAQVDLLGGVTVDESLPSDASTINFGASAIIKGDDPHLTGGIAIGSGTGSTGIVDGNALFGADGQQAGVQPVYSLTVTNAASGLLTTEGVAINLVRLDNGVVVGVVSGTGTAAFAVSIDAATGVITVEQYLSLRHPQSPNNYDEAISLGANTLGVVVTATDFDNDVATSPAVNISNLILFQDDGPTVDVTKAADGGVTLTTFDALTIGTASNFAESGERFNGVFDLTFNGGADGAVAPTLGYTLNVAALSSGLSSGGLPVNLYKVGTAVVGTTGGQPTDLTDPQIVFTVEVSTAGVVKVTQYQQIDHSPEASPAPGTGTPFDDQFATLIDGKITLTASSTITDGDLDTATNSETVDLGGNIRFADHGPIAAPDTDFIASGGSTATGNVITDASAGDLTAEDTDNGRDTAGADAPVRVISGDNTLNVTLAQAVPDGGFVDILGQYGTLRLFSNGDYTYTRNGALGGGESETFQYTIRDFDGDTATSTLTIAIGNATPSAGTVTIKLDDDAVGLNGNPDGPGDDINFEVSSATLPGLGGDGTLTRTFAALADQPALPTGFNYGIVDADTIQIRQGTTVVVTLQITNAATGAYTVTQNAPILHGPNGADGANFENNIDFLGIKYVVTDIDNDPVTGFININVDDDSPVVGINVAGLLVAHDETPGVQDSDIAGELAVFAAVERKGEDTDILATGAIGSATDLGAILTTGSAPGADGGTTTISLVVTDGVDSGLRTTSGAIIRLYNESGIIVGRVTSQAGDAAIAIAVNSSGDLSIVQYLSIQHPTPLAVHDEPKALNADVLFAKVTVTDNDGDTISTQTSIGQLISFQDDGPIATNDGNLATLDDNASAVDIGAVTLLTGDDNYGADGVAAIGAITIDAGDKGGTVTIVDGKLIYTAGADGNVAPGGDPKIETFVYTIKDGDGDTTTATFTVTLTDPALTATAEVAIVDDDGLLGGNDQANVNDLNADTVEDGTAGEAIWSGTLAATFGVDVPGKFTFAEALELLAPTAVGQETVTYVVSNGGLTLTANIASSPDSTRLGDPLFTVQITNINTGTYTVTLNDNVLHATLNTLTGDDTENPSGPPTTDVVVTVPFTATDSENESTTANLTITFDDDMASFGPSNTTTLNIDNNANPYNQGTFVFSVGADTNADNDDISLTNFAISVNGTALLPADYRIVLETETAASATYRFSFDYDTGSAGETTTFGTIVLNKSGPNAGTYTVALDEPLTGFSTLETADGTAFVGYAVNTNPSAPDVLQGSQPPVAVTTILAESAHGAKDGFYVQFTGIAAGNGGHETINYGPVTPPTGDGLTGIFSNGELFSEGVGADALRNSYVSVSGGANGVGSDTVNGPDALNFDLYSSNPGGTVGGLPTTSAGAMFLTFDGIGNASDMIVVLKLWSDTDNDGIIESTDAFTTRAVLVQNGDIYRFDAGTEAGTVAALAGTDYADKVAEMVAASGNNNDGLVIIESNDYNFGTEKYQIIGAQVVNAEGTVDGTAINLNRAVDKNGVSGDSDADLVPGLDTQVFGDAPGAIQLGTDPIKITSIGFLAGVQNVQNATISFTVNVTDDDGDRVGQNYTVNVGDYPLDTTEPPPPPAMTMMMVSQEPANDTFSMSMLSTESADSQLQKTAANNNTGVVAAAVAAAGLASSQAAAQSDTNAGGSGPTTFDTQMDQSSKLSANDNGVAADPSRSLMGNESRAAADDGEEVSSSAFDAQGTAPLDDASSTHDAPTELLAGTDAADGNAAAASMVAPMIVMPSVEALASLGGHGQSGGQHNAVVGKVLAEALEGGGGGGQIDALLAGLAGGGNSGNAALDALASQNGDAVPVWDMGNGGSFQADVLMKVVAEAMTLHHDAVQPAING